MRNEINLQDRMLSALRQQAQNITVFLTNGFQMRGIVRGFDSFVVILESDGKQQMIYKHAISTLIPQHRVDLPCTERGACGTVNIYEVFTWDNRQKAQNPSRENGGMTAGNRVVFIIAAVLMVIYLGGRLSNAFSAAPETTPALHVTVNDSFTSDGWFFRDEEPIDNATGSSVKHIVYSGERVQQDAPLAIIYSDQESMDLSRQLDPLEERISLLDTALQSTSDSSNIAKLDQVITLTIEQLAEQVKEGSGSSVASAASSLRTLSLRREAGNVDTNEVSAERDALVSEQSSLEHQLTGRTTELTASSSGYFSEVVDGYESILTPSSLDEMTVEQFDKTVAQQPSAENSNSLGKIVKGFNWYLAAKIPAEQAERLQVGQELTVNFTQASMESKVTVHSINHQGNSDTALLVMEGTEFSSEMVSMREQPIEIIIATYTGLKVPKSAVRVQEQTDSDGKTTQIPGVFILSGSIQKFKMINELFEADDYYVVEQSATNSDMLVERDQVIVQGKNLQNNMVVKT